MPKKIKFESYRFHLLLALNIRKKSASQEEVKNIDLLLSNIEFTYVSGNICIEVEKIGLKLLEPLDECILFKKNNLIENFIGDSNQQFNKNYFNECVTKLLKIRVRN